MSCICTSDSSLRAVTKQGFLPSILVNEQPRSVYYKYSCFAFNARNGGGGVASTNKPLMLKNKLVSGNVGYTLTSLGHNYLKVQ